MPKTEDDQRETRVIVTDELGREVSADGTPLDGERTGQSGRRARRAALTDQADDRSRPRGERAIEGDRPSDRQTRMDRRLGQLRRQIGDRDSEIAMLRNDLRLTTRRLAESGEASMTHYETAAKARLEQWEEKLAAAHEAGDTKGIIAATREIASAQFAIDNIALARTATPKRPAGEQRQEQRQQQPQRRNVTARTQEWIDDHPWFETDPQAQQIVGAAHNAVVKEGIAPDTDEYFDEVERRIAPLLPESYLDAPQERETSGRRVDTREDDELLREAEELDREDRGQRREPEERQTRTSRQSPDDFARNGEDRGRAPVGGVRRAGGGSRRDGGVIRLTQAEMQACRDMGVSPDQYARNRARLKEEGKIGEGVR